MKGRNQVNEEIYNVKVTYFRLANFTINALEPITYILT